MNAAKVLLVLLSAVLFFATPVRADDGIELRNIVLVKVREVGFKRYPRGQDFTFIWEPGQPADPPYKAKFRVVKIYAGHLRAKRLHFLLSGEIHTTTLYLVIDATDPAHPELLSWDSVFDGYCPLESRMRRYGLEAAIDLAQKDDPCTSPR